MKKQFLLLKITLLIYFYVNCYAQDIFLEKSNRINFNEKIVKTTLPNTYSQDRNILANSVIEFENRITFYDSSGKIRNEIIKKRETLRSISNKGKYISVFQRVEEATKINSGLDLLKFYDSSGKLLWIKNIETGYETFDNVEHVFVSDNKGTTLLVYPYLNKIECYMANGDLFKTINTNLYGPFEGKMSDDGNYFSFITGKAKNKYVALFSILGDEIWRYKIPEHTYKGYINIFPDAAYVFASAYSFRNGLTGSTFVFNKSGQLINKFEMFFSKSAISQNNEFIALSHRGDLAFIDIKEGKVLFYKKEFINTKVDNELDGIISLSVNNKGDYILIGSGRKEYPPDKLEIYLLNNKGDILLTRKFENKKCSANLDFSFLNKNLLLQFDDSIYEFKLINTK